MSRLDAQHQMADTFAVMILGVAGAEDEFLESQQVISGWNTQIQQLQAELAALQQLQQQHHVSINATTPSLLTFLFS